MRKDLCPPSLINYENQMQAFFEEQQQAQQRKRRLTDFVGFITLFLVVTAVALLIVSERLGI